MSHWSNALRRIGACSGAIEWCATQPSRAAAWRNCERGDQLLWISVKLGADCKLVTRAACACVRTALVYVPAGESGPRIAIETAEAWCRGEATIEEVEVAAAAAFADYAGDVYARNAAAYAARAARNAADTAVYAVGGAADAACTAAVDTANAHAYADAELSLEKTLRQCADIVRSIIPMPTLSLRRRKERAA